MENKVSQKNIDRIKQYDSNLADIILTAKIEKSNISLGQTELGEYNIFGDNIPLHSPKGAVEEAKNIVSRINYKENPNAIRIVYGLGLGYLADVMSEEIKGKLIIYEPNLDLIKIVLSLAQIDALYRENVFLCHDKKKFKELIIKYSDVDTILTISTLPFYKNTYNDDIVETIKTAQKGKGERNASENTYMETAPLAIRNTFQNLKHIFKAPNILEFKDIYKGKTALCLSAGPSSRKAAQVIKDNRDKFIIFAVNPIIKLLKEFDILPDFVVGIESRDFTHQIKHLESDKYYLITEAFSCIQSRELSTLKTINYISKENYINYWVCDCLGIKESLKSQGTVSYAALMSAYIMGFDKIILCGQDLAYQDGKCYAAGSQYEELECVFDDENKKYVIRARDFDKYVQSFVSESRTYEFALKAANYNIGFLNNNLYTVKGQNGEYIPTQTGYALFIDWFSDAADEMKSNKPEIQLINSSEGGAQIDGFENMPLQEAIKGEKPVKQLDLTGYYPKFDKEHALKKVNVMYENLSKFLEMLKELDEIAVKMLKELKIKKIITQNILKLGEKHKECLFKILNEKNNKEIREIILVFLNDYANIIQGSDCPDVKAYAEMLEEIKKVNDSLIENVKIFLQGLANSKPFIS